MLSKDASGTALRTLRALRGMTQREVSERAGIKAPMLSAYESGRHRVGLETLERILSLGLGVSLSHFFQVLVLVEEGFPRAVAGAEPGSGGQVSFADLGEALRRLRRRRRRSLEEVALRAGITAPMLSEMERGAELPSWATIEKVLGGLEASLGELVEALEAAGAPREERSAAAGCLAERVAAHSASEPSYAERVAFEVRRSLEQLDAEYRRSAGALEDLAAPRELAERMVALVPPPSPWDELVGPSYGTAEVEKLLGGVSRQAVAERRQRRTLLALRTADGRWVYPAFQFDDQGAVLAGLPEVLRCFRGAGVDGWALAGWLASPLPSLGDRSPIQRLREGEDLERLLAVAREAARRLPDTGFPAPS